MTNKDEVVDHFRPVVSLKPIDNQGMIGLWGGNVTIQMSTPILPPFAETIHDSTAQEKKKHYE